MNAIPKVGDFVQINKAMALGRYRIGEVVRVDGHYIYVRMNYKGIVIERYPCEMEPYPRGKRKQVPDRA